MNCKTIIKQISAFKVGENSLNDCRELITNLSPLNEIDRFEKDKRCNSSNVIGSSKSSKTHLYEKLSNSKTAELFVNDLDQIRNDPSFSGSKVHVECLIDLISL